MRVSDLDRDMRDVIPTGTSPDSEFLFARMTGSTFRHAAAAVGDRVLDVACGLGQDARALAVRGVVAMGAEPSARMSGLARLLAAREPGPEPGFVRGFADALPFASRSFDAVFCKGSLDHFDRPACAIAEMARVARPDGRVVLAIANFESLSCRAARAADALREDWLRRPPARGRRFYDVPSDHFTRYDLDLMREQAGAALELFAVEGVSLAWGLPRWSGVLARLPRALAQRTLAFLDALARRAPGIADVVVLAGRPRSASTSR